MDELLAEMMVGAVYYVVGALKSFASHFGQNRFSYGLLIGMAAVSPVAYFFGKWRRKQPRLPEEPKVVQEAHARALRD
mgnify:CR=1 FL=1